MALTWSKFASANDDATSSFESLSAQIFCNKIGTSITNVPKNYPGLEAKPVKASDSKYYGYQSKFFQNINATEQKSSIKHSLENITDNDLKNLSVIYIFVNTVADSVQTDIKTNFKKYLKTKKLKNIKLKWFCGIDTFINELNNPQYEGSVSMYFGTGRPLKLHLANISDNFTKTKPQKYYIEVPLLKNGKPTTVSSLLKIKSKCILIKARAGTGKSWLLNEVAYRKSSLKNSLRTQQINISKNGIVIIITAQECTTLALADVLNMRLSSFGIKPFAYSITLILDNLDEVDTSNIRNQG